MENIAPDEIIAADENANFLIHKRLESKLTSIKTQTKNRLFPRASAVVFSPIADSLYPARSPH